MNLFVRWLRRAESRFAVAAVVAAAGLLAGLGAAPASAAPGRIFYLSPSGNDQADGLSQATAWKTLGRVSQAQFGPGDQILLQGGAAFDGQLVLEQDDAGTAATPVTISTYGNGRATIRAAGAEGIKVYNAGGVEIRGLNVVGDARTYDAWNGILFYADDKVPARLAHVVVNDVEVSGFQIGIALASVAVGHGFQDVTISNSTLRNNRDEGLLTYGPSFDPNNPSYAHSNVQVRNVTAHDNAGNPQNTTSHSGSGIVLGSVDDGVIEASTAYNNGSACASTGEGPVGIWTYDSTGVTIQRSLSYRNRTGTTADGGGFDLDQNVSNSYLQYNLSYQNSGPGLLVFTAQSNDAQRGNTVRFNISVDDAIGNGWYGGLTVAGRVANATINNNTIVTRAHGSQRAPAVKLTAGLTGVTIRNNVLLSQGAGPAVSSQTAFGIDKVVLQANAYYRQGGGPSIEWGTGRYNALSDWRSATGQEKASDGRGLGVESDPKLRDESATPNVTDPTQLASATQFALASDSPAGGRGLDLATSFQAAVSPVDYYGAMLGGTRPVSIGAAQPATALASTAITAGLDGGSGSADSSHRLLWTIALALLLLVGGGAFTVSGRQLRARRRRVAAKPVWSHPQHTIVVPSDRGKGRPLGDEQERSGGRHYR